MLKNELDEKIETSKLNEEELKEELEHYNAELDKYTLMNTDNRLKNSVAFATLPWVLASAAAVGLAKSGVMDPGLVGPISLFAPAIVGLGVEKGLLRRVVDSKTISEDGIRALRNEVFYAVKKAETEGKLAEENGYQNRMLNENYIKSLEQDDLDSLIIKEAEVDNELKNQEEIAESIATKLALQSRVKGYDSKYSVVTDLMATAAYSLGVTCAYVAPMYFANIDVTNLHIAVPAILSAATIGTYKLVRNNEKRKLYNKYAGSVSRDIDLEEVRELTDLNHNVHEFVGELRASKDICNEVIKVKQLTK